MKFNNNQMGELKKTTLRLSSANSGITHEVNIAIGSDKIQAVVKEVSSSLGGSGAGAVGGIDNN